MVAKTYNLKISEDDPGVAYLEMPNHPLISHGIVKKSIRLHDLIGKHGGPDVNLDFDENNTLIGIELIQ
jgi:hypothetical protein